MITYETCIQECLTRFPEFEPPHPEHYPDSDDADGEPLGEMAHVFFPDYFVSWAKSQSETGITGDNFGIRVAALLNDMCDSSDEYVRGVLIASLLPSVMCSAEALFNSLHDSLSDCVCDEARYLFDHELDAALMPGIRIRPLATA